MLCRCLAFIVFLPFLSGLDEALQVDPIFLTVSSLFRDPDYGADYIDRELQLNWNDSIEEVGLFTDNPMENPEPVCRIKPENIRDISFYETNITLGNPDFPNGWAIDSNQVPVSGDHCLKFWIGSYKNGILDYAECLKIRPTWMNDHRHSIGNMPLTSMFIPGTHNSGCYNRGRSLSKRDVLARYILTQDQDVYSQLVYGIRYIDLRVGIYPIKKNNGTEIAYNDNCFWINHDMIKVQLLVPILKQIRKFLDKAKEEIVILDFHRFPVGFSGRHFRHSRLVDLLRRELGDYAAPYPGHWPRLNDLWNGSKRLIISYGDRDVGLEYGWLWPPISQKWANENTISGLQSFLDACMNDTKLQDPQLGMWAAMAQLTPSHQDILFKRTKSLRTMAHTINYILTKWCQENWWKQANIVTSDFFLENNVISVAIAANIEKGNMNKRYDLK